MKRFLREFFLLQNFILYRKFSFPQRQIFMSDLKNDFLSFYVGRLLIITENDIAINLIYLDDSGLIGWITSRVGVSVIKNWRKDRKKWKNSCHL